jgi:hypothetical protein
MRPFLKKWFRASSPARPATPRRPRTGRLDVEALEDRLMPVVGAFALPPDIAPGTGFDGIVRVRGRVDNALGTGSLLSTGRDILTAAHVVDSEGQGGADRPATVTFDLPGPNGSINTVVYTVPVSDIIVHPGWNGVADHGNDLAILHLPALAPSGTGGAERYQIQQTADEIGQVFRDVGYGNIGVGATGADDFLGAGTKHSALNGFAADGNVVRNEVQAVRLTGNPTGGTFHLQFNGQTTGAIPFNANAAQVRSALQVLPSIGIGNVDVHGGPALNSPWFVTFQGALGNTNVNQMPAFSNLTGSGDLGIKVATRLEGALHAPTSGTLVADFDNGQARNDALALFYGLHEVSLGANEGLPAQGDSGGPALTAIGNRIAGINSASIALTSGAPDVDATPNNSSFGEIALLTRVSTYASFINAQLSTPRPLVVDMFKQPTGGDGAPDTITVTRVGTDLQVQINGVLAQTVPLAQVTSLSILGSTDNDQINVNVGFAIPVTVDGVAGADGLLVQGTPNADSVFVTSTDVGAFGQSAVTYSRVQSLLVATVDGNDTVTVFSTGAASTTIGTGRGNDTISLSGGLNNVIVNGGSDSDTLQAGAFGTHIWQITGGNAGTLDSNVSFSNVENLTGSTGPDLFAFSDGGSVAGVINGNVGSSNLLDYSARTTGVVVDLTTGAATGVAGGVFNVQKVAGSPGDDLIRGNFVDNVLVGGGGNDILVGMDGNDQLIAGGDGRSILIGGLGADTLVGGTGEDILIGGWTDHDLDDPTLAGIRDKWVRTDLDYQQRIALLRSDGVDVPGQLNATTVHDDLAVDQLTGNDGPNWFWSFGADVITDLKAGERVN